MKRRMFALALAASAGLGGALVAVLGHAQEGPRVIAVTAQRFSYTPNEIVVKRGEPVVLAFTSKDFTHGFTIPDLNLRADLPPGKVTRVSFTPESAGTFDFLCDNFCGAGHEEMSGKLIVTP
jgi:cytochrome c oxidase subunit 2